ncbi:MAG: phosphotransferase [Defluviitaleaceae bacterium]|nr:phosphotransferase [Defluviitaleaceae bacterium]
MLFNEIIDNEDSWGKICQRLGAFEPLIKHILSSESLPAGSIVNTKPSANAVYKAGKLIVKIFAPKEARHNSISVYETELFGQKRALSLGVPVPKIHASGIIRDRYEFPYIVSEFIDAAELKDIFGGMNPDEKYILGQKLREISDKLNTPCSPFNEFDCIGSAEGGHVGWLIDLGFGEKYLNERKKHILSLDLSDLVFCHGDFDICNILYDKSGKLYLLDFADAILAPAYIEHMTIALSADFDESFIRGYFGEISADELVNVCFNGFMLSINGAWLLANGLKTTDGRAFSAVDSLTEFNEQLGEYIARKQARQN